MSLSDTYRRQYGWRDWASLFAAVPALDGCRVLDVGCGPGDQAAELVARGASVVGLDLNAELLEVARARGLANTELREVDLRSELPDLGAPFDGLWCGFVAAYFPDLTTALQRWRRVLAPGGWVLLTEIEDLFGHVPLDEPARSSLPAYAEEAFEAGRYDFHMGGKLAAHAERAGFTLVRTLDVHDAELAFDGPAAPGVLEAWRERLDRMRLLRDASGAEFEAVREAFLKCLAREDHHATARVVACLATC